MSFTSKTMSQMERSHAQLDRESVFGIFGIKIFHLYVTGQPFEIPTDHKPREGQNRGIQLMKPPRMQRWALTLPRYQCKLKRLPRSDALSRLPITGHSMQVSYALIIHTFHDASSKRHGCKPKKSLFPD